MADHIIDDERMNELYAQLAEKVLIEKEVQTAEIVQKSFYPAKDLDLPNLRLCGHSVAATQCSGDWWQYAQIKDYVLFAIGDVTGHGVAAALVTAAVQSAFCILVELIREAQDDSIPSVFNLSRRLDMAVRIAGADSTSMSLFCGVFDTKTGTLTYLNRSHCKPYLLTPDEKNPGKVQILNKALGPLLGFPLPQTPLEPGVITLDPGQILFLYTDGLFDNFQESNRREKRKQILEHVTIRGADPKATALQIMEELKVNSFSGPNRHQLIDDWTMILCQVPWNATLKRS